MLAVNTVDVVERWIVPRTGYHSDTASSVRSAAHEDVIVVFVKVVGHQEEEGVGVGGEDADGNVEKVVEIELGGEGRVGG